MKLINKTYATTREEKDKLTEVLQTVNEEVADLHEKLRRANDTNKDLIEQSEEAKAQCEALTQSSVRMEEEMAVLQQDKQSLEQQYYAANVASASKIAGLLEELERYKTTIAFLESDKEELIAEHVQGMEALQSMLVSAIVVLTL